MVAALFVLSFNNSELLHLYANYDRTENTSSQWTVVDELIQKASANYLLTITNPIITTYRSSCVVSSYNNDPGIGVGIKSFSFQFRHVCYNC